MVDELRAHQWPSDKILARLDILDQRFARVETILVGMPDTDERGIVGDVHELFRSRNDCEKDIAKIRERCNMEHGKDPGGKVKGTTIFNKAVLKWLIVIASIGAFIGGVIVSFGDRYNWW